MQPGGPASLIAIACLFIALGLKALVLSVIGLYRGTGGADLSALDLLVGVGLLRRDPYWRRWALVACWLGIVGAGILFVALAAGSPAALSATLYGRPLNQMSQTYALTFVLLSLAITAWGVRVSRHHSAGAVFAPRG